MSVEIKGMAKLKARILELQKTSLNAASVEGSRKTAENIRDTAKSLAPVDTGSLQKSIRLQTVSGQSKTKFSIGVSAGGYVTNPKTKRKVDYAAYQEYGTSKTPPQPFMRPAIEKHKHELPKNVRNAIK